MIDTLETHQALPLDRVVEALLFVATFRVSISQLAEATGKTHKDIEGSLEALTQRYLERGGLRLQWHAGRIQLTTAPELAPIIERFLGLELTSKLSKAALETLSIVAYRQPITRPIVDTIRGVNSDGVMRSLLHKGLIEELGRAESPGRPIIYGTTEDFLQYFGLTSLQELPPLEVDEEANQNNGILKD